MVELVTVISLDAGRSLAGSGSADANAHSSASPGVLLFLVGAVGAALFKGACRGMANGEACLGAMEEMEEKGSVEVGRACCRGGAAEEEKGE